MTSMITSIILWLLSYFLSKKAGAKSGTAALIATGVTAGAYYSGITDKITNSVTDLFSSSSSTSTDPVKAGSPASIGTNNSVAADAGSGIGSFLSTTVTTAGDVLKSWGGVGTAAVVGTTGVVKGNTSKVKWALIAGAAILILRRK